MREPEPQEGFVVHRAAPQPPTAPVLRDTLCAGSSVRDTHKSDYSTWQRSHGKGLSILQADPKPED